MEIFLLILRLILAAVFALAGIGKLYDLEGSEKAVKNFGVPEVLAKPVSILLPLAEISVTVLLLFSGTYWFGAIVGFGLLAVFIGGMIYQMYLGNAPDCHCFGQIHSEPVSPKSLIRNVLFAVPALFLILRGQANQGFGILDLSFNSTENNFMQLIIGLIIIGFLAAIVYFLKQISEQQTQIMRRIDVLEVLSHESGRETEREDAANPEEFLPIGAPAPDFELPNVYGRNTALEHLLAKGKPLLLFFVGVGCNPCAALLPEIENWQKELGEKLNFVFISNGKAEDNLKKFAGNSVREILLQEDNETGKDFNAVWTPTALLVNSDGTIGSRPAVGDAAIRKLLEKIENQNFEAEPIFITNENTNGNGAKFNKTVPAFSLENLEGGKISQKDLRGKKTLVAFWSMDCGYCVNMMDDLRDWDKQKGMDEPNLVVFSTGKVEAHQNLNLESPVLLDENHQISKELGMSGTPSAILVNEDGKIISEIAVGAPQIWALLGKRNGER